MRKFSRILCFILSFVVLVATFGVSGTQAATPSAITIYLDDTKIVSDVAPFILPKVNVTMVPVSVISKNLKAGVSWAQSKKTVTITNKGLMITMKVGEKFALVNGKRVNLDASAQLVNGRVMVPLRFVSNQLKLVVTWYASAQTIKLQTEAGLADKTLKGAWVSTVYNLDWPSSGSYGNSARQQQEYIQMLDELQGMGMNTVFVQVRPSADSFYPSKLVPWSKYLQGKQGQAPDYDPLAFMVAETHRRGMEFQAWFNPFRANTVEKKPEEFDPSHVVLTHPEWIVQSGSKMYINPGIPEARQHIIDAIMEVVNNYEIDGVHLDDYFYPSDGQFLDDETFALYNTGGFTDKGDWRRDNINLFVQQLGQKIHKAKPQVKYGISPFGVWRNLSSDATGSDTKAGVETYDDMYADVRTWIRNGWIDYVVPQIYWSMTLSVARYDKLVDWWASEVRGTNVTLYIGHAPYKLGTTETGWNTAQEIINQLTFNKNYFEVKGDVFFSAKDLRRNPLGLVPLLQSYYKVTKPAA